MIEHGVLSDPGTKLGTVSQLFARSHPLTHERKLAKTKGGILCLVPRETEVGDVICRFIGSAVPFILRPLKAEDWRKEDPSAWSRFVNTLKKLVYGSDVEGMYCQVVDMAVSDALNLNNVKNYGLEVQHHKFIGECYVDGLMSGGSPGEEVANIAFALQ